MRNFGTVDKISRSLEVSGIQRVLILEVTHRIFLLLYRINLLEVNLLNYNEYTKEKLAVCLAYFISLIEGKWWYQCTEYLPSNL